MMALFRFPLLGCLLASPLAFAAPVEELPPPDVDPYLEVMLGRADLAPLLDKEDTALRLRFGFRFNDARTGPLVWSGEGGLSLLADADEQFSVTRTLVGDPNYDTQKLDTVRTVRLNGFELGARITYRNSLYLRSGMFINTFKERLEVTETRSDPSDNIPPPSTSVRVPTSDSENGLDPYVGAGVQWYLDDSFALLAEYDLYRVQGERIDSINAGIRILF